MVTVTDLPVNPYGASAFRCTGVMTIPCSKSAAIAAIDYSNVCVRVN